MLNLSKHFWNEIKTWRIRKTERELAAAEAQAEVWKIAVSLEETDSYFLAVYANKMARVAALRKQLEQLREDATG